MLNTGFRWRLELVFILIGLALVGLVWRLFSIQITNHYKYLTLQQSQSCIKIELPAAPGTIYDRHGAILAISNVVDSVYAVPVLLAKEPVLINELAAILKLSKQNIQLKLEEARTQKKHFIWLKRRLSQVESGKIARYKTDSIGLRQEYQRFYPNNQIASHLIGFRGLDEQALAGIELGWDKYLTGTPGYYLIPRDARQKNMASLELLQNLPQPGNNIYLTIDLPIQCILEQELAAALKKWKAKKAFGAVLNPQTGEILALANHPTFDPNNYQRYPPSSWHNPLISDVFEPGSTFKPFIAGTALDTGIVSMADRFFGENGAFKTGKRTIHDHKPYGWLTFTEVLSKSSNICMSKIGLKMGKNRMYNTLKQFEFDKEPGSQLPGETCGLITNYQQWNDYTTTSVPWGHEIGVSALQLIKAFAVFANNGYLLKPQVIQKITTPQGKIIKSGHTELIRRVIHPTTAQQMKTILTEVVNNGTGTQAQVNGYQVAGKTGTAQKLEGSNRYSHTKFMSLFIGFAPAAAPQLLVLIVVDEPHGAYYGGTVAAPAVGAIIHKSLTYLKVPPQANIVAKKPAGGNAD